MPIIESTSEQPFGVSRKLVERLDSEITRLAKKVDNAQGFAVNSKTTLAVAPPVKPQERRPPPPDDVEVPLGEFQYQVFQNVSQNTTGFDFPFAHGLIGGDEYE